VTSTRSPGFAIWEFRENFGVPQIPMAVEIGARLRLGVAQLQQRVVEIVVIGFDSPGGDFDPEAFRELISFFGRLPVC
jgi:hypothetical protein